MILCNYGACLTLETVLPDSIASHTPRIQTSKELDQVFPSQSDKDKDTGEVNNAAMKKLRVWAKKHWQPSQEDAQLSKLQKECNSLVKAMSAACKPKDAISIKSNANLRIQGARLLLHSAWNWTTISGNSCSQEFRLITGVAVLEFNIISEYHDHLLESTPAAVVLWASLAALLQPHMKKLSTYFVRFRAGSAPDTEPELAFADRITSSLSSESSFSVEEKMSSWQFYRDMEEYQMSIQKIVHAVEKSPLAWKDPASQSKSPALNEEVHEALQCLVNISNSILLTAFLILGIGDGKECSESL